jgi:hypothetical protein
MRMLIVALLLLIGPALVSASPPHSRAYVRVVQENGVWWFEDGGGRKLFSLGVNCIGGCYGHAEDAPIQPTRRSRIVAQLQDWGFNTAGCWSSPSVWDEFYVADQIYPEFFETRDDVFDESFWTEGIADHLAREVQPFLGRANVLGYFLDNEREWDASAVFDFYLRLPNGTPGSRAIISYLAHYYQGDLARLNADWGTSYASFEQIAGTPPPAVYPPSMRRGILPAWRTEVAVTYYRRLAAMVRALDPHHLILGIRYRGIPDEELFTALSPYFDVNSVNDYNRYGHLRPVYAELYKRSGKPLMITEFSFSAFPHPGQLSDLFIDVYRQEHRGLGYHKYVQQAARAPFMVGMHWFMWMDYPEPDKTQEGGYPYPPDRNVGLVSHDESIVYEELTRWVTRTNAQVQALHRAAGQESSPTQEPRRAIVRRLTPVVDGDLAEWPASMAMTPTEVNALVDKVQVDHTYFLAWDEQALYLAGDIADTHLAPPQPERAWQGDYLAIELKSLTPTDGNPTDIATVVIFPTGGGADHQQPHAARGVGRHYEELALQVARRPRPGGYTIEARLPITAVEAFAAAHTRAWHLTVRYQDVQAIYQAGWEGIVTLAP